MMNLDADALMCDLAETYNIMNYKELPCSKVALFAVGLRENSRIKMKMNDMKFQLETILLAAVVDRLSMLTWLNSKDAKTGINRPESIVKKLTGDKSGNDIIAFRTPEEFEKKRLELIQKGGN